MAVDDPLPDDGAPLPEPPEEARSAKKRKKTKAISFDDELEIDTARRFVTTHGANVRYCPSLRTWFVWDGTRWGRDELEVVREMAKGVADDLRAEASARNDAALWKHARRMGEARGINAMLTLARSDPRIAIKASAFDSNPMLLNCPNGTLDLSTGELYEHRREELNTRITVAPYVPTARSARWEKFLASTFGADDADETIRARAERMIAFVRRAAGYSITADTREEKCFLALGDPRAGKGTFFGAIAAALGEYAKSADIKTFLADKHDVGDRGRPDLVRLVGARFVVTSEMKRHARLDEARLKGLTGRDLMVVRDFHKGAESFIEALPSFKLWFFANDPPMVSEDDAIWTRLLRIPFKRPVANPDPTLKSALTSDPLELAAVLAWSVAGAMEWVRDGLAVPDVVKESTAELRAELDGPARFVSECVVWMETGTVSAEALRAVYERWCRTEGERPLHARVLANTIAKAAQLAGQKVENRRGTGGARSWRGFVLDNAASSTDPRTDPMDFYDA